MMRSSKQSHNRLPELISHRILTASRHWLATEHLLLLLPLGRAGHGAIPGINLLFLVSFIALGLSAASLAVSTLYRHIVKKTA